MSHSLPWPKEVLQKLGEMENYDACQLVILHRTEPGDAEAGTLSTVISHTAFASTCDDRSKRWINFNNALPGTCGKTEKKRPGKPVKENRKWLLGEKLRTRGSIHCDWWRGTAADLAASEYIAVFPVTGWWRERPSRNCYNKQNPLFTRRFYRDQERGCPASRRG